MSTRVLLVHRYELARRGLRRMLEELPYVAEVAEEPYRGGEWGLDSAVKSLGGRMSRDSGSTRPRRFRVTLKAK